MLGIADLPDTLDAQKLSAQSQFSIQDYGRIGDQRPYQIVQPSYPAPKFLQRYFDLDQALNECRTMCQMQGVPFRVLRWGTIGVGLPPCASCARPIQSRFPRPVFEVQPGGKEIAFDAEGKGALSGMPHYVVSADPFPPFYKPGPPAQRYLEAVRTAQILAAREGRRAYVCSSFGADCPGGKRRVPVVYVQPGGLARRHAGDPGSEVVVTPVTPSMFKELLAESRGASYLPANA